MSTPFLSEIRIMSFNFAPRGWAECNGQLLPINQNQALFSLLGTTYGGDGRVNFGLPNLQGRIPMHMGSAGFGAHTLGERGGEVAHTVSIGELGQHSHSLKVKNAAADVGAAGKTPNATASLASAHAATTGGQSPVSIYGTGQINQVFNNATIGTNGGSQPHENEQPFLALNFCIALQGIFPSQN
ncbi:MAG TPA: tail fiber protein [Rhizomicrobium sp.]|jgi:microcystin-dependent protein